MAMTNEEAHELSRKRGTSKLIYGSARVVLRPPAAIWYRLKVTGSEYVPTEGPAIIAPNHKSFWDSFFIAVATTRHLRFMGKTELFEGWAGPLLVRLGAFPVRRGEADADALETARTVLRQGGLLALFPEGTRVRDPEGLGSPKRGAGRLALETGAPLVPAAITGTERLFVGPFPRPVRVQVAFGKPIEVRGLEPTPEQAAKITTEELWPEVEESFDRLATRPGVIVAALTAAGVGGALMYSRRRRRR